jgi:hypothetical protein
VKQEKLSPNMRHKKVLKMARLVPLKEADRDFDITFWQKLGAGAILSAAWDLVVTAERMKNPDADLRLQRHIAVLKHLRR